MMTDRPAVLRDTTALFVDDGELAPQVGCFDRDRFFGDSRERGRRAKDVHHVDGDGHVAEALIARLSQDLRLARVHRDDAIPRDASNKTR